MNQMNYCYDCLSHTCHHALSMGENALREYGNYRRQMEMITSSQGITPVTTTSTLLLPGNQEPKINQLLLLEEIN